MFKIRFWGVRGSIPAPGPKTSKYGGNTLCIQIITDLGYQIVIDSGTGIRELGNYLLKDDQFAKPLNIHLFLTHTHWDHINGFPFFTPIYVPKTSIAIYSPVVCDEESIKTVIEEQFKYRYFPVRITELNAEMSYNDIKESIDDPSNDIILPGGMVVKTKYLNHPIACMGYRFEYEGKVFCTCYDHEPYWNLFAEDPDNKNYGQQVSDDQNNKILEFFKNSDLLVHDTQFTEREYKSRMGWGHSTFKHTISQAMRSNVKNLALFHYSPEREDFEIDHFGELVKKFNNIKIFPSYEGQEIIL